MNVFRRSFAIRFQQFREYFDFESCQYYLKRTRMRSILVTNTLYKGLRNMARNPQSELVWQGRIHLGDEPGVYGDSQYSGLAAELPLVVTRLDQTASQFSLILDTESLETFANYPGHDISVVRFVDDPAAPFHSIEQSIANAKFTGADNNRKVVPVTVGADPGPFRIAVRLRIDTTVNPGFYDDFVWLRLSLQAVNFSFVGGFGFPS